MEGTNLCELAVPRDPGYGRNRQHPVPAPNILRYASPERERDMRVPASAAGFPYELTVKSAESAGSKYSFEI